VEQEIVSIVQWVREIAWLLRMEHDVEEGEVIAEVRRRLGG